MKTSLYYIAVLTASFGLLSGTPSPSYAIDDALTLSLDPPKLDYSKVCIKTPEAEAPKRDWTKVTGGIPELPARRLIELGHIYEYGMPQANVAINYDLAARFFRKATESRSKLRFKGHYRLANLYINGRGVPQDIGYAKTLLEEMLHIDASSAGLKLALLYMEEQNSRKAAEYFRLSAVDGNIGAALYLGNLYSTQQIPMPSPNADKEMFAHAQNLLLTELGKGRCDVLYVIGLSYIGKIRPYNEAEAVKWFEVSSKLGHVAAMNQLAKIYSTGAGEFNKLPHAIELWTEASKKHSAEAMFNLGKYYLLDSPQKDNSRAEALLEGAASKNYHPAIELLVEYYEGEFGHPIRHDKSFVWLKAGATRLGASPDMIYGYANAYDQALGTEENHPKAVELFRKAAVKGHRKAAEKLGIAYQRGRGVEVAPKKSLKFFRLAASRGNKDAMVAMSRNYSCGVGTTKNPAHSQKWHDRAISYDSLEALIDSAELERLKGTPEGTKKRIEYLRRAVKLDSRKAMVHLGVAYLKGEDIPQDKNRARTLLSAALADGLLKSEGLIALGDMYAKGVIPIKDAFEKAHSLYSQAVSLGDAAAAEKMGKLLIKLGDGSKLTMSKAVALLTKAANKGEVNAMIALADFNTSRKNLKYGIDAKKGAQWLTKAAAEGHAGAMLSLAYHYHFGTGTLAKDKAAAKQWVEKALLLYPCSVKERVEMARYYDLGIGVERNTEKAAEWAAKALESDIEETGDMTQLATMYRNGFGVDVDPGKSRTWYERAANAGDAKAMQELGKIHMQGDLKGQDVEQAHIWFDKAMARGNVSALEELGKIYAKGKGVERDEAKAVEYLKPAAQKGALDAMVELGVILGDSNSDFYNPKEAESWLKKAANIGLTDATFELLDFYDSHPTFTQDEQKIERMIAKLAGAPNKSTKEMIMVSRIYLRGIGTDANAAEGVRWLEKAANAGDPAAMRELGRSYIVGKYILQSPAKGVTWLQKASEFGDTSAMVELANAYAIGNGVEKNMDNALSYYNQAANLGSAAAMRELGYIYIYKTGVGASNEKTGINWFMKAAGRGDSKAMLELSNAYAAGFSVKESPEKAQYWLEKAANAGNKNARRQLRLGQQVGYGTEKQETAPATVKK